MINIPFFCSSLQLHIIFQEKKEKKINAWDDLENKVLYGGNKGASYWEKLWVEQATAESMSIEERMLKNSFFLLTTVYIC